MVEALRDTPVLAETTRQNWTSRLRGLLAWAKCELATDRELWYFPAPVARKRPYLQPEAARAILLASEGRERIIIVLGLFNGLRACEIGRLKVRDVDLEGTPPMLWVLGKGRRGGKVRRVPVSPLALGELQAAIAGKRPEQPVYDGSYATIDKSWRKAQARAGFKRVGTHALRRSFGRISHDAGTSTEEIQAVYGHASPVTTTQHIGVEETRMARGLARMAEYFPGAR